MRRCIVSAFHLEILRQEIQELLIMVLLVCWIHNMLVYSFLFLRENTHIPLHFNTVLELLCLTLLPHSPPPDVNVSDDQGSTPLHWAVEKHEVDSCALLLDLGADPNILNAARMSPLHLAISKGYNDMVEVSGTAMTDVLYLALGSLLSYLIYYSDKLISTIFQSFQTTVSI